MPINNFNRVNPFIIIMRRLYDEIRSKLILMTSSLIKYGVVLLLLDIAFFILFHMKMEVFAIVSYIVLAVIAVMHITKNSKVKEVDKIIFSDEYAIININNEKILSLIEEQNIIIGYIQIIIKYAKIYPIVYIVLKLIHLIIKIILNI